MIPSSDRLLTIVIPTLGRPGLQQAIDSALSQSIRCDLVVEHDPNRTGCGATLNRAIDKVATPWYMGVADDDMLLPTVSERVHELQDDADMIIFRMQYPEGHWLPTVTSVAELVSGNVGSSFALRTEVAREIRYVDNVIGQTAEDWEMIARVRLRGYRILIVPEIQVLLDTSRMMEERLAA